MCFVSEVHKKMNEQQMSSSNSDYEFSNNIDLRHKVKIFLQIEETYYNSTRTDR